MTIPKPKPRKPLDPVTLRWCARGARGLGREWPLNRKDLNVEARIAVAVTVGTLEKAARRFEREARAARKRQ